MDPKYPHFSLRTVLNVLLVFSLHKSAQAQQICTVPQSASIPEGDYTTPGLKIADITTIAPDVTLQITQNPYNLFHLNGNELIVEGVVDYEIQSTHTVTIQCNQDAVQLSESLFVIVGNVNDNAPVFKESQYTLNVDELTPVGTPVDEGVIEASDADGGELFYTLDPETEYFTVVGNGNPTIQVQKLLDYDTVNTVTFTLTAWDTRAPHDPPSFSATTTININIVDIDNRPPWFQPCTPIAVGIAKVCPNSGYTGTVNLTQQETGALPLDPGPVRAIDGDSLNAAIMYAFLSGNEDGIFDINSDTGDITMKKAVDVAGPIVLTVLAAQSVNNNQFATTMVTFHVVKMSSHPPRFEKTQYEGFIAADAGQGSMVMEGKSSNKPLRLQATDADYANGVNPDLTYEIQGTNDFSVTTEGFILMTRDLSPGSVSFNVKAVDPSYGEASTTLVVEVTPGTPTSTSPPTTIEMTTVTTEMTSVTTEMTSVTTEMTSETLGPTTNPSVTTQDALPTSSSGNTADPHTEGGVPGPSGDYRLEDMVALGATMAVLLIICMVVVGLLVFRIQKGKAAWRKLSEASIFRSSLGRGPGGLKEGVQYTNEGFQNDGDTGSVGSKGLGDLDMMKRGTGEGTRSSVEEAIKKTLQFSNLLPDSSSLEESDKADSEKEVKPILTKERRVEEGYKSVWFKEDIDPNAKEEVVIIPDSREEDGEDDEDEGSLRDEEEESFDNSSFAIPKVAFASGDLDNGLKRKGNEESDDEDL